MNDKFSFFENRKDPVSCVITNDKRLARLAEYDATEGFTKYQITPDDVQTRFTNFKNMVKRGSLTLKELETSVYSTWGVTEGAEEKEDRIVGFHSSKMSVADIPEDSPDNH